MKKYFILASLLSLSSLALATPNLVHQAEATGDITLKVIRPVKLEVKDIDLKHVLAGKKVKPTSSTWHITVPEQDSNAKNHSDLVKYNLLFRDQDTGFGNDKTHHHVGYLVSADKGKDFERNAGDDTQIHVKLVGRTSKSNLKALVDITPTPGGSNNNIDQFLSGTMRVLAVDGLNANNKIIPTDAFADIYEGTILATLEPAFNVEQNWQ